MTAPNTFDFRGAFRRLQAACGERVQQEALPNEVCSLLGLPEMVAWPLQLLTWGLAACAPRRTCTLCTAFLLPSAGCATTAVPGRSRGAAAAARAYAACGSHLQALAAARGGGAGGARRAARQRRGGGCARGPAGPGATVRAVRGWSRSPAA